MRKLWVIGLGLIVTLNLFAWLSLPSPVRAAGGPLFIYQSNSYSGQRLSKDEAQINARFEAAEDGLIDENIGFVTIELKLRLESSTTEKDRWTVSGAEFSNANFPSYGSTPNNSSAQGSVLELRNKNNEVVARYDFSSTSWIKYGYEYRQSLPTPSRGLLILKNFGTSSETTLGPADSGNKESPIAAFQYAGVERFGGSGSLFTLPVDNYDSGGSSDPGESTAVKWFGKGLTQELRIKILEEKNKPPTIEVAADPTRDRPKIRFKLAHIGGEGSGWVLWNNVDWLVFDGYEVTDSGKNEVEKKIENLYLLTNDDLAGDDSGNGNILFDSDKVGVGKGKFTEITDNLTINKAELNKLFGYIYYNVPKDNQQENCGGETVYKVGPDTKDDYRHYDQIKGRPDPARQLNGNCLIASAGWPAYWGVSLSSAPANAANCTLAGIFKGGAGISDIFKEFTHCLIESIFKPTVTWAAQLVGEAAGISSAPREANLSLSLKPATISSLLVDHAYAQTKDKESDPLKKNLANYIPDKDGFVYKSWRVTIGLVNIVLVVALLVISFSNITRFNLSSYEVKKALPNLFIGILLANASFFLIRFLVDIATAVTMLFVNDLSHSGSIAAFFAEVTGALTERTINTIGTGAEIASIIIVPILMIVTVVLLLWLAFLLYFRLVAVYLLAILAPIAFVAYGIPGADSYFKQWWQQFSKWLFMVPAMAAVFWLMLAIHRATSGPKQEDSIAQLLIMYVLFFIACTIPTRFGGKVMNDMSGFFRKYSGVGLAQKKMGEGVEFTKERAGLRTQQVFYRTPVGKAIQRYNEKRSQDQENMKKDVDLLKKERHEEVMEGRTGRNTASLSVREEYIGNRAAKVTNEQVKRYLADHPETAKKLSLSDIDKVASEKALKNSKDQIRLQLFQENETTKPEDINKLSGRDKKFLTEMKKVFNDFGESTAREQLVSGELSRQEGIFQGNVLNQKTQLPQLLFNYTEREKEIEDLKGRIERETDVDKKRIYQQQLGSLQASAQNIRRDYDKIKQIEGLNKFEDIDFSQLSMEDAAKIFDGDKETIKRVIGEGKDSTIKLLQGQQRQGAKAFTSGVKGQITEILKDKTAFGIERDMRDFLSSIDKHVKENEAYNDLSEADKQAKQLELKQAFFSGNTSKLAAEGMKIHEIRNGIVAAEQYKIVTNSTSDVRNADVMQSWMKVVNEATGQEHYKEDEISKATSTSSQERRNMGRILVQEGVMAGSPGERQENGGYGVRREGSPNLAQDTTSSPPTNPSADQTGEEEDTLDAADQEEAQAEEQRQQEQESEENK